MSEDIDFYTAQTGNFIVSAYPELLDEDDEQHRVWGYCLRIENNSDEPVKLLKKNLCLTDECGKSLYDSSLGFNGELPDLQPGEYFEYEETAQIDGLSAVLYGFCSAVTAKGKELKINFPIMNLGTAKPVLMN